MVGCGGSTFRRDATFPPKVQARIARTARRLVEDFRKKGAGHGPLDAFLHEYKLSDHEGVVLMCLAEALLRIPDAATEAAGWRRKSLSAGFSRSSSSLVRGLETATFSSTR